MKKNKWIRAISLIAAVLLFGGCAAVLGGCGKGDGDGIDEKKVLDYIVKNNASPYTIAVPEQPSATEQYAAEELQSIIAKSTGVYLPVRGENQLIGNAADRVISIGNTRLLAKKNFKFDYDSLNGDGFYMQTADKNLYIAGALDRGTLYGVYDFVEQIMGVRFFASDCTYIPELTEIPLNRIQRKEVPAFRYRTALNRPCYRDDGDRVLYARQRSSHEFFDLDEKYGGQIGWYKGIWVAHNTLYYVPVDKYFSTPEQREQNRDMYVLNAAGEPYDICWTNGVTADGKIDEAKEVSTLKAAIESLKSFVLDDPNADYYAFAQEDYATTCTCARCQASTNQYYQSGTIIRFVNLMIDEVQKWADARPDLNGKQVKVVIFTYHYSTDAPVEYDDKAGKYEPLDPSVVPDENIVMRIAPFYSNRYYSLADPRQTAKQYPDHVKQWGTIAKELMTWTYACQYDHYFLFYPTIQRIPNELREFQEAGVTYALIQLNTTEQNDFQSILNAYVYHKLLWDPTEDPYALRKEFITHYFGPAAQEVQTFLEFMEEYYESNQTKTNGMFFTSSDLFSSLYHPLENLEYAYRLTLTGMEKIAASDLSAEEKAYYELHLNRVRLVPLYMMMMNRGTYFSDNVQRFNRVTKEFFDLCDLLKVEEYAEMKLLYALKEQYPYSA